MNSFQEYIYTLLPPTKKSGASGWTRFNCPCCKSIQHESRADSRSRGGLLFSGDITVYNCFNCKFSWVAELGKPMPKKLGIWLKELNATPEQIATAKSLLEGTTSSEIKKEFKKKEYKPIPSDWKSIRETLSKPCKDKAFNNVVNYLSNRNPNLIMYSDFYWSPKNYNHLLIPYYENNKQCGYALRRLDKSDENKYIQYIYSGFIYNNDALKDSSKKNIIVCEGALDALSLGDNAIAVLQNYLSGERQKTIKYYSQFKNLIFLPDKDKAGKKLIEQLLEMRIPFSCSFPQCFGECKDAAEAVAKRGQLFTLYDIMNNIETNPMLIKVKLNQWS